MRSFEPPIPCRYFTTQRERSTLPHIALERLLSFLLPSLHRPRFCCFLSITPNHDHAQETPDYCRSEKDENHWDSNGPDAGGKEVVEGMALVDEGLGVEILA